MQNENSPVGNTEELNSLIQYRHEITSLRVNLLTFSFTTVLAVIGIAFSNLDKDIPTLLYLLPYFLITPFAARITYYRMNDAHRGSFLCVFYPNATRFNRGVRFVQERQCQSFRLIAWLVNVEMFLLAGACSMLFLCFEYEKHCSISILAILAALLPLLFVGIVIHQGYNYGKIHHRFLHKWELAKAMFGETLETQILSLNEIIKPILIEFNELRESSKTVSCEATEFGYSKNVFSLLLTVLRDDCYLTFTESSNGNFKITFKLKFIFATHIGIERYLRFFAP